MTTPIILWTGQRTGDDICPPGTVVVNSLAESLASDRGCVVVVPDNDEPIDRNILTLLAEGFNVVTTGTLTSSDEALEEACARGHSTFHHIGHHTFVVELIAATVLQGPTSASHIRILEACRGTVRADDRRHRTGVHALARAMFEAGPGDVDIEITSDCEPTLTVCGFVDGVEFYRGETFTGPQQPAWPSDRLPFGDVAGAATYAITVVADPGDVEMQWQLDRDDPALEVKLALDAVGAVVAAAPGILVVDARPHYRPDDRLPA